ncbi:MAG: flagellar protein FlgN [Desulfuromonadaceae bacterium]|nr:flagellar protein FlgN [Desulfuromonadaceae bacterium]
MELKKLLAEISLQTGLLNELLQVLERETVEMGDVDTSAMDLSNRTKEELFVKIAGQTPILQQAVSAQAVCVGLPVSASLGEIAECIAKRGNRELLTKQQQIHRTAERIRQVSALNVEIAERFSSSVTSTLGLIMRLVNQSNIYGASGGYQQRPASAVMVNREA